jgi:signal transduction histidine kinase
MEIVLDYRRSGSAVLLEQMGALLGAYQFALGHELPNRLVVMQAFARMLSEQHGAALDDEGRALLQRLATSAQRAHEQALRLAEIGRLCREIETEEGRPQTALGEVVREAVAEVNVFSDRAIDFRLQEKMPVLPISRRALHQVLVELLRNAVQAAIPGQSACIEVGAAVTAEGTEVWVRDQGRGLTEEQGARLFGPFNPGNSSGVTGGGLGLGLFLVRQVVARWGGALTVRSRPGAGTTIGLLVPLANC